MKTSHVILITGLYFLFLSTFASWFSYYEMFPDYRIIINFANGFLFLLAFALMYFSAENETEILPTAIRVIIIDIVMHMITMIIVNHFR